MNYVDFVCIFIGCLFTLMSLLTLHFFVFGVVGVFKKKTFPETDERLKYGIIIPARNEEAVVGNLIDSVYKNNYPQDKLQVFVIAHNCTDNTAEVARSHGATVYEYNNPNECTMGYAFRYLFDCIRKDYGVENYDGFFLFNADNILDENYFSRMNDAFVSCGRECVITSFRNSKNFASNLLSSMYGLYFIYGCRFESRGRSVLGCSTRVQGTGYVVPSELVKNGWEYVTLTEDWEFTVDQILRGTPIVYCDDAVFYDEQPTKFRVMWRQRLRWSKGHLLVCIYRMKDLLRTLFTRRKTEKEKTQIHKFWTYDISVNILPVCVIGVAIYLLQVIMFLFAPLFGCSFSYVVTRWFTISAPGILFMYLLLVTSSVIIYIIERDRIPHFSIVRKILSVLLWPFFLFLSIPAEVVALFTRNVGWKEIPHTDTTDFDKLNGGDKTAVKNK